MPIPTYDKVMPPLLQFAGDGQEHSVSEAVEILGEFFHLTEQERSELVPNGTKSRFYDRVTWAKTYLKKAGLIAATGRGLFRITPRGEQVLDENPTHIDRTYLKQFPEFLEFITPSEERDPDFYLDHIETPRMIMYATYQNMLIDLAEDLLDYVLSSSPTFFERLVIDLLLAMGYGSSLEAAGKHLGKSGDGGLDGYIQEDKLGLDTIYVQAKRYSRENSVGRPAVQGFVGSLMGAGANKGVFITTSRFSREAVEYARSMQNLKIILIDGQQLTQLMIEHDVGVSVEKTYIIKRIDSDYFDID